LDAWLSWPKEAAETLKVTATAARTVRTDFVEGPTLVFMLVPLAFDVFSRLAHFVTLDLQWGTGGGETMSEYQTVSMYSGKQGAVFGAVVLLHLLMGYALYAGLAQKIVRALAPAPLNVQW